MTNEQVGDELPPEQLTPFQPVKLEALAGVAVNVTAVPAVKEAFAEAQLVPHEIPDGVLVTVPLPVPDFTTVRATVGDDEVNIAVTLLAPLITSEQLPVPVQSPDQPEKLQPAAAVAVNVAPDPLARPTVQVLAQSATVGEPLIRTVPLPLNETESGTPPPNDPQVPIPDACTVTSPVAGWTVTWLPGAIGSWHDPLGKFRLRSTAFPPPARSINPKAPNINDDRRFIVHLVWINLLH